MTQPWLAFYDADVPAELHIPELTLPDLLALAAKNHPNHTACVFMGARINYRQLKQQVDRLAAGLHSLGIGPGDRVAIMLPNCPQAIIAYYATLSLGAVTVMTNPLYVERELEHQWGDSGVKCVISLNLFWQRIQAVQGRLGIGHVILGGIQDYMPLVKRVATPFVLRRQGKWVDVPYSDTVLPFNKLLKRGSDAPQPGIAPTDLACLQYTGGTTGLPKGAMLSHRNLIASISQVRSFLLYEHGDAQDIGLAIMPFFHVYGMNGLMNLGMHLAATLVLIPQPEIKAIVDAIVAERPTFFTGVPALFTALNNYKTIDQVDLTSIKAVFSGAAPLPVDVMEKFEARTGARIAEAYGMTEASSVTHVNPLKGVRKFGSIGVPIIGTDAKIVDVDDPAKTLGVDEAGELMVKGPQVMQGYWNRPEETAETLLDDGWLRTGDIARMDEQGYFYIVDRKKDMILSAGYNVYPREVEEVLYQHPKVLEAAVIGLPDGLRGEKITAYVTLMPGETATPAEIRQFCKDKLAPYKQPRAVVFQDDLPKTLAGKILRRQLREAALEKTSPRPTDRPAE